MPRQQSNISVVQVGIGAMGEKVCELVSSREGIDLVGAVDEDSDKVGSDIGDIVDLDEEVGIHVSDEVGTVLSNTEPDIVSFTTAAWTAEEMVDDLTEILERGVNVVSSNVGFFYPYHDHPTFARKVDRIGKNNDASLLCTGINPGFALDTLVIALTALSEDIDRIVGTRTVDFAPYGASVLETEGFGLSPEEWQRKREAGEITGHDCFGFQIQMIADAIGIELEKVRETTLEPVIAEESRPVHSEVPDIEPGQTAGLTHVFDGLVDEEPVITLKINGTIDPSIDGFEEQDEIVIEGNPDISIATDEPFEPGTTTWTMLVNMMPPVINTEPGLVTMDEMPLPSASLGDMRQYVDR